MTHIEYDKRGRVVSIVTVREPEYSADDMFAILASRREEARPRGSHGLLLEETTDPANEGRYRVGIPIRDHATTAINHAQKAYRKKYGEEVSMDELLWEAKLIGD